MRTTPLLSLALAGALTIAFAPAVRSDGSATTPAADGEPQDTNTTYQPTNAEWLLRYDDGGTPKSSVSGGPSNPSSSLVRTPEGDVAVGQVLTFDASASAARSNNVADGGSIVSWIWDFGDGAQANAPVVQHAYDAPGIYRVNLTVHDATGWRSQKAHTVVVAPEQLPCGGDPTDVFIETTDPTTGVTETMHGVLTLPTGTGPFPVILEYGPYTPWYRGGCDDWVRQGYAIAHVAAPGRGRSTGEFDFFGPGARQGGYDAVEWLAAQPWSNGNVGMVGLSGPAVGALLTASANPPHLKAVVAKSSYSDLYRDMVVIGGIPNSNTFINAWAPLLAPQDFTFFGNSLGPNNEVLQHAVDHARWQAELHLHPFWDEFWAERRITTDTPPSAAVLYYGNQQDLWPRSTVELARWITPSGGRVISVPGGHAAADVTGWGAGRDAPDYLSGESRLWLDHHLKGVDNGVEDRPEVLTFAPFGGIVAAVFNYGRWEQLDGFPATGQRAERWYLRQAGTNPDRPQYHGLSTEPPAADELPTFLRATPAGGATADDTGATAPVVAGLQENHEATALVFETPVLDEPLEVNGPATLTFHAALASSDVGFTVQVDHVWPDGSSHAVSKGSLLASHRALDATRSVYLDDASGQRVLVRAFHPHTQEAVETLIPGVIYRFDVELWGIHNTFREGHRMRIALETQDTGFHTNATPGVAAIVYNDAAHPSSVNLPVWTTWPGNPFPYRGR